MRRAGASARILPGDAFAILPTLPAESFDAGVMDPPYGLGFMGREWDTFRPERGAARVHRNRQIESDNPNLRGRTRSPAASPSGIEYDYSIEGLRAFQAWTAEWARLVFRLMKPGAYLLVCGAPRSYHRMASGLEDGGFVIRDAFSWLFGSGFPKSRQLAVGVGTALKPGHEPIAVAWKPFAGAIQAVYRQHGTGGLNIDACRLPVVDRADARNAAGDRGPDRSRRRLQAVAQTAGHANQIGRWPTNVLLDEYFADLLDREVGALAVGANPSRRVADAGGPSRFFYVAKASRAERDLGCEDLPRRSGAAATHRRPGSDGLRSPRAGAGRTGGARNIHPTVKPIALMRWLVRLATPPGGMVLDAFAGSGSTGCACLWEGRRFVGIEREATYLHIAEARLAAVTRGLARKGGACA